jgi:hypothetical protein
MLIATTYFEGTFAKRKTWGLTFVNVIIVEVVESV